jgi:hypothetical protein
MLYQIGMTRKCRSRWIRAPGTSAVSAGDGLLANTGVKHGTRSPFPRRFMAEAQRPAANPVDPLPAMSPPTPPPADDADLVFALIAEGHRLDALVIAAETRGDEILNTLPEDIREGRVRVSFSDSELGRCLSNLSGGHFISEEQLQRFLTPWQILQRRWAEREEESPEAAVVDFNREIGLDQVLAQLRAGLEEIKAIREASGCEALYREAEDHRERAYDEEPALGNAGHFPSGPTRSSRAPTGSDRLPGAPRRHRSRDQSAGTK